ncbi:hypothetical protein QFZ72_000433 [Bacillus sp. V2I10]|nr:hypothetical protein [Bacillus sp. V2I10]
MPDALVAGADEEAEAVKNQKQLKFRSQIWWRMFSK